MRLTLYSDYALRVLVYVGSAPTGSASIQQISRAYNVSRHHLTKVVNRLARIGLLTTTPGRGGGMKLAKSPADIRIGETIRQTEPNFHLVECLDDATNQCVITSACKLRGILSDGLRAFLDKLNEHTLADLLTERAQLQPLLGLVTLHIGARSNGVVGVAGIAAHA
ncbi:MAG: Rrf2 family transcriptional regulator [Phycisphaerae bacterium]